MKVHLCCGATYLTGYLNCDIVGENALLHPTPNDNETTVEKYFKIPFEMDATKRIRKPFIIDHQMNILEKWPFLDHSIDEIITVSTWEHFEHKDELPHLIQEAYRCLKPGAVWKFDFPDIKKVVELYHDDNMEFCAEQIYCNHKNKYSVHQWGYSPKTIPLYLTPDKWDLDFKDVVKHDYPMTGCWAVKK